jgi:hypothetical protein
MKKLVAVSAALMVVALSASANAQTDLSPFGVKGTFAIDAQGGTTLLIGDDPQNFGLTPFLGWHFRHRTTEPANPGGNYQTRKDNIFYLNPGVDYFVIDNLSIGGEVLFALSGGARTDHFGNGTPDRTADTQSGTYFGLMPRVGYNIALSNLFSIWPRGGIGFQTVSYSGANAQDRSETAWFVFADVPFLLHPVEHFFIGAGPGVTFSLGHSYKEGGATQKSRDGTTITDFRLLSFVMGGYF